MAALICIKMILGTFCSLGNIANRFLSVRSSDYISGVGWGGSGGGEGCMVPPLLNKLLVVNLIIIFYFVSGK